MKIINRLTISDEEFLANSIRCWQDALKRGDYPAFEYWAVHAFCFARDWNCHVK